MKRLLSLITFGLIVFAAPSFAQSGEIFEKIKTNNAIQCGYAEWPQFFDVDPNSGEFSGFFYDFWDEVGKELEMKIVWNMPVQWGQVTTAVKTKKIDIFCNGVWPDAGRRRNTLLSSPIVYTPLFAYGRVDDERFKGDVTLETLNDPSIKGAVLDSEATEQVLEKYFPKAGRETHTITTSTSELILSVATGKSDFIVMDVPEMEAFMKNSPGKIKKISDEPVVLKQVQVPLALGEEHLLNALNGIIHDFINDGTIKRLIEKHEIEGVIVPPAI